MSDDNLCQCPNCGRMHRSLGFDKPPEAIAGKSLLRTAETIGGSPASAGLDSIARALFGPTNRVWDQYWQQLHDVGLQFQSWSGASEPTEGKSFYREQARIVTEQLRDRIGTRLNAHLIQMKPGWDDSIVGFNDAWAVVSALFDEILKR